MARRSQLGYPVRPMDAKRYARPTPSLGWPRTVQSLHRIFPPYKLTPCHLRTRQLPVEPKTWPKVQASTGIDCVYNTRNCKGSEYITALTHTLVVLMLALRHSVSMPKSITANHIKSLTLTFMFSGHYCSKNLPVGKSLLKTENR